MSGAGRTPGGPRSAPGYLGTGGAEDSRTPETLDTVMRAVRAVPQPAAGTCWDTAHTANVSRLWCSPVLCPLHRAAGSTRRARPHDLPQRVTGVLPPGTTADITLRSPQRTLAALRPGAAARKAAAARSPGWTLLEAHGRRGSSTPGACPG